MRPKRRSSARITSCPHPLWTTGTLQHDDPLGTWHASACLFPQQITACLRSPVHDDRPEQSSCAVSRALGNALSLLPAGDRSPLAAHSYRPRYAASSFAMSNFTCFIISSAARLALLLSGSVIISPSTVGVICQRTPYLSMIQPHAWGLPPLSSSAFQ